MHYPSLVAQMVKNLPAMQETQVQSLGWEDLLEKEMATRSSILAWKIPWTEKPGGLPSMGSQKVKHNWATNTVCVTQQGLKEFRGREWKCSASNGNEEASEGQKKTRSKGQRAVCMRTHRGSQGWKEGWGQRKVSERSQQNLRTTPTPPGWRPVFTSENFWFLWYCDTAPFWGQILTCWEEFGVFPCSVSEWHPDIHEAAEVIFPPVILLFEQTWGL